MSHRLLVVGLVAVLLNICLLFCLYVATKELGGRWLGLIVITAAALAVLMWCTAVWIIRPFLRLEKKTRLFLERYAPNSLFEDESIFFTPTSQQMWEYLQKMLDSSEVLKLNKRQAQYLALQNQINPHFLYNTLESIRSEVLVAGVTDLAEMTEALASFFRYTISKVENLVSVEEELQNCETYFKIQQYRFAERLQLTIDYDSAEREEIYNCRLPKLTMQPILENSIIHGTECKIGTGHLKIHLERTGEMLFIRISDDGVGMDEQTLARMNGQLQKSARAVASQDSPAKGGIALRNVNNRIHLLFGEEYGLCVFSMPGVGTDVEILLPAITSDRNVPNKEALFSLLTQNLPLRYGYVYYHEKLVNDWHDRWRGNNRISVIRNESCLAKDLTVADNIFVLRSGFKKWHIRPYILRDQLIPFIQEIGVPIRADAYIDSLTTFQRFVVELLKAVVAGSRLIVLDNVDAFISESELAKLQEILLHYAEKGISFLYLSAHFEETLRFCHRTALMSNGRLLKCFNLKSGVRISCRCLAWGTMTAGSGHI